MGQTCSQIRNDTIEDSEVDNLRKDLLADFIKDANSTASFPSSRHFESSRKEWRYIKEQAGCQDSFLMAASEVASFETNFLQVTVTSQAEISVSGTEAECLLAIGDDKKRKPVGVTSFKTKSDNLLPRNNFRYFTVYHFTFY